MATNKPTKPDVNLPESFGGIKTPYTESQISSGYEDGIPQIVDGGNINYEKDGLFQKIKYVESIADVINGITPKKTLTVDSDNRFDNVSIGIYGYSETQTYELDDVVISVVEDEARVYRSRSNNNVGNQLTNIAYWEEISLGEKANVGFNLFDFKWSEHLQNDASWLRSDTFSWQSGDIYTAAYNELLKEFNRTGTTSTDTIEGIDIVFKRTAKGYKIVDASQEAAVANIFDKTGVAWYYILDIPNKRFKLPRNKYSFRGTDEVAGNYFKGSAPDHTHYMYVAANYAGVVTNAGGNGTANTTTQTNAVGGVYNNDTYQLGAAVQSRSVECYLYFYVGNFVKNQTEVDVGELTEALNGKADNSRFQVVEALPETLNDDVFYFLVESD